MTIQDVADQLGVSKKKVWTAVKCGQLEAVKAKRGNAWRYSITEDAAEAYRLYLENSDGWTKPETHLEPETIRNETVTKQVETPGNGSETLRELFDRLELSHRRQIFLEMQLQQSQRLLCEVNEDQHEREARAKEAEAKVQQAQKEAERVKIELESLKTEVAAKEIEWAEQRRPWYKKLFSKSS